MPREVERQSERFASAPHLEDVPDGAYRGPAQRHDRSDYNERTQRYDSEPVEGETRDEQSGFNWGPPPNPHHIPDPGFREAVHHNYVEPGDDGVTDLRPYSMSPEEYESNRAQIIGDRPAAFQGGGWEHVHPTRLHEAADWHFPAERDDWVNRLRQNRPLRGPGHQAPPEQLQNVVGVPTQHLLEHYHHPAFEMDDDYRQAIAQELSGRDDDPDAQSIFGY